MGFSPVPSEIKPVAHLMKLAEEHESRNIVVAYWARMAACRLALNMTPGKKSPETSKLLVELLDWLEQTKKTHAENEGIVSETAAQAIIEEYALRLFEYADQQDRAEIFNKNTIKAFYNSGILMDVLEQFQLSEDLREKQRYAKWKAAFIHNSLKNGEKPYPGAPSDNEAQQKSIVKVSELSEEERKALGITDAGSTKNDINTNTTDVSSLADGSNISSYNSDISPESSIKPMGLQQPGYVTPVAPETPALNPQPTTYYVSGNEVSLTPDMIQKAQKYSKYATSALNYDDIKTAIDNLQKALNILQLGKE